MSQVFKRTITALSTAALVVLAIVYAPTWVFRPICAILTALASIETYQLVARKMRPLSPRGLAVFIPAVAVVTLSFLVLPRIATDHGNLMMLYVIAIVKVSDMGGFALGLGSARLMKSGNHKLCPSISPNKSWEGLVGSVLASCILSCLFMPITHFCWLKAIVFGIVAAIIGTLGDLAESKFKRWAGVKDSATFMPAGLGGFLDMFDSLLFAPFLLMAFI